RLSILRRECRRRSPPSRESRAGAPSPPAAIRRSPPPPLPNETHSPAPRPSDCAPRCQCREREFVFSFVALRRDALDHPILRFTKSIDEAIVQTIGASLPEFDDVRDHAIAAPVRRTRNGDAAIRRLELAETLFERAASENDFRLVGSPGAEL